MPAVHYTSWQFSWVPNSPKTPNRNFRFPDDVWDGIKRIADDRGVTATDVVLLAVRRLIRDYPNIGD